MLVWIIFAVISIVVLGIALVASRGRASRRNSTSEVWSETEVDYKARSDRIPNLEETLKIYAFPQRDGSETHATPSLQPVSVAAITALPPAALKGVA